LPSCSRCIDRNIRCNYESEANVYKEDLRAELRALKLEGSNSRTVLDSLLRDGYQAVVARLRLGESIDDIARSIGSAGAEEKDGEDTAKPATLPSVTGLSKQHLPSVTDTDPKPEAGRGFVNITEKFRVGEVAPVYIAQHAGRELTKWLLTPMDAAGPTLPPSFIRGPAARRYSFDDLEMATAESAKAKVRRIWTKVTPNQQVVNHLIGLFFTWEFPLFTMVSQKLFLRDYYHGSRDFCSPALVNAISALATRYMKPDLATSPGDVDLLGETFFRESLGLLVREARVHNLTSVQAFALLAVREMSCGRELEAQELCLQAIRLLRSFDLESLTTRGELTEHLSSRSLTFSGLLSLIQRVPLSLSPYP
jgi:hypothetical protein